MKFVRYGFRNWKLRTKISVSFILVVAVFIASAALLYKQLGGIALDSLELIRLSNDRNALQKLSSLSRDEYINTSDMLVEANTSLKGEDYIKRHKKISAEFRNNLVELGKSNLDSKYKELLTAIQNGERFKIKANTHGFLTFL